MIFEGKRSAIFVSFTMSVDPGERTLQIFEEAFNGIWWTTKTAKQISVSDYETKMENWFLFTVNLLLSY